MNYFSPDALPAIKLIPFPTAAPEPTSHTSRRPGRATRIQTPRDLRWLKVQEFLRSSGLSPNTQLVAGFAGWVNLSKLNQNLASLINSQRLVRNTGMLVTATPS